MRPDSLNPGCAYADDASPSMKSKRKRGVLDNDDEDEETVQLVLQALLNNSVTKDEIFAIGTVPRAELQVDLDQLMSSPFQTNDCNTKRPRLKSACPLSLPQFPPVSRE